MWPFIILGILLIVLVFITSFFGKPHHQQDVTTNDHSDDFKDVNKGLPHVKHHHRLK
jgi:hypothetical protein